MGRPPKALNNGEQTAIVIDPSAENSKQPVKSTKAKSTTATSPTGKDEEDFYRQAGEAYRLQHRSQDLGWLGRFFGSGTSAATNIAGLVAVIGLVCLVISFCITAEAQKLADAQKLIVGIISSALSFIFGAASKK
ncbi:hypothetical protein ACO0LG_08660 [Undibacterium sp. Ji42W]|uniref:hypothetical protein n=1 Tax=Undibacterium sp. Ji42W TaxID=3413039 RepID=UPI003BF3E625